MSLSERNELRMKVWEFDEQIQMQMQLPEPYRNTEKITSLKQMIEHLEQRIAELR